MATSPALIAELRSRLAEHARPEPGLKLIDELACLITGERLRPGQVVAVSGSLTLLLRLLAGPSTAGAWCALVGFPAIGAEAAAEAGIRLSRLVAVDPTGGRTDLAIGALVNAIDIVAVYGLPAIPDAAARRLTARARDKGSVLVFYAAQQAQIRWPGIDIRLTATARHWSGLGEGFGRLRGRELIVAADGRATRAGRQIRLRDGVSPSLTLL